MTVGHRTRRVVLRWLRPRDIAADLGISVPTACRLIREMPCAERLYAYQNRKGEVWRILREDFRHWKRAQSLPKQRVI